MIKILPAQKSVFNRAVGDNDFELEFAEFLENCEDIVSFAKNHISEGSINFNIDYKKADGSISRYFPDFFVKVNNNTVYVVETKGREDLDDPFKIERLRQWCEDANGRQERLLTKCCM